MILSKVRNQAFKSFCLAATCLIESLVNVYQPTACWASTGFDPTTHRLRACVRGANCVSSNYAEPPNSYIAPFSLTNDRSVDFRRIVDDLSLSVSVGSTVERSDNTGKSLPRQLSAYRVAQVVPADFYIHLTTPGTAPGSIDDVEMVFPDGGDIVNVRCDAQVVLPPPPFCVRKNCINANMDQRRRVEELGLALGLSPVDQLQMREEARWTPIFFNSDRVPDT